MSPELIGVGIAICGFALSMIGGMIHIVWVLSRMRTQLDRVLADIEKHECHGETLQDHAERISRIEERLRYGHPAT